MAFNDDGARCTMCDDRYNINDSDAMEPALYCSIDCEQRAALPPKALQHFAARVRAILVDDQGRWRPNLSGADVIDALSLELELIGLGGR